MKLAWIILTCVSFAECLLAQENSGSEYEDVKVRASSKGLLSKAEGSEFTVDPNLVDKLFSASVEKKSEGASHGQMRFDLGFGLMLPVALDLDNKYFDTSYSDQISSLPLGTLQLSRRVLASSKSSISILGSAGYSNVQDVYKVESNEGIELKDSVTLQWIPLEIGLAADIYRLWSGNLIPVAEFTGGMDWISQSGSLDGMNQTYWIPHLSYGGGFRILANDTSDAAGFDGISFLALYHKSFASSQSFRGWAFNITGAFSL